MSKQPIYSGELPMDVVAFGSGSCTTIDALLKEERDQTNMYGHPDFRLAAFFTDTKKGERNLKRIINFWLGNPEARPIIRLSPITVRAETGKRKGTPEDKIKYDEAVVRKLAEYSDQCGFRTDLIALAGYMRLVLNPLLDAYNGRIINSHPADLRIEDGDGTRKYRGDNAVYDAIAAGESETRTCIHAVTSEVDGGPLLVTSKPLGVALESVALVADSCSHAAPDDIVARLTAHYDRNEVPEEKRAFEKDGMGSEEILKALMLQELVADQHQELQKRVCDYPAYITALNAIANGALALDGGTVHGRHSHSEPYKELPKGGIILD